MLIVESQSLDIYRNLAIEEYLMEQVSDMGPVLFLWRSTSAVVMGKNQNPWKECRLDRMRADGVALARRISGGGTVYHDTGNLNYCVIVDRSEYRQEQAYEVVVKALNSFGVQTELSGKTNLSVDGLKFSGNAFCFRKGRALHHGTLLLDTDLDRLGRYLGPSFEKIETRAISSVPARVMNLGLEVAPLSSALETSFVSLYGNDHFLRWTEADLDEPILQALIERQQDRKWIYGATPKFSVSHGDQSVSVEHGAVVEVKGPDEAWIGMPFEEVADSWGC